MELDPLTEAQVVEHLREQLRAGHGGWIVKPNINVLRTASKDPAVAALLGGADLVVADGMPVVWTSRVSGTPLPERVAGSSLLFSLSAAAAADGRSAYLLGGAETVPERAATALVERYPGLKAAGTSSPPFGFDRSEELVAAVLDDVASAAPDLVFVGLGTPRQERLRQRVGSAWLLACGAAIPMAAGELRRAPVVLQRAGLEWALRLAVEPAQLARRYLIDDAPFAAALLARAAMDRLRKG
jgi:N-acetylglucosaminyldiphosphoundecaprenol N-acetyl-beta-D-mannosaminyltransferase